MSQNPLCPSPPPKLQFFVPGTNTPLNGGLLFTYEAGTTIKQNTYANDNNPATPNTNPIVLDANGECVCFLDSTLQYALTLSPPGDTDPPTNPYFTVNNMGYAQMITSLAPLNSPTFTGNPQAPSPTIGDNSQAIATTQFVQETITNGFSNAALTGTPTAPTASPGTLTTQIASTAFVGAEIAKALTAQWFTATGTFNVPAGVAEVWGKGWGGGGGGGAGTATGSCGGGGGGGGYFEFLASVTPAQVLNITIGSGGAGATSISAGTSGGTTTVAISGGATLASSAGGTGGSSSSSGTGAGGAGGSATGVILLTQSGNAGANGINGSLSVSPTVNIFNGGTGGASPFGGPGGSGAPAGSVPGAFPGGGGSGGGPISNGAAGAPGAVVLYWLSP